MILLISSIVVAFIIGLLIGLLVGSKSGSNVKNVIDDITKKIDDATDKTTTISEDIEKLKGIIDSGVGLIDTVKEIPGVSTLTDKVKSEIDSQVKDLSKTEDNLVNKLETETSHIIPGVVSPSKTASIVPTITK